MRDCDAGPCPSLGPWSAWSPCPDCGPAQSSRTRWAICHCELCPWDTQHDQGVREWDRLPGPSGGVKELLQKSHPFICLKLQNNRKACQVLAQAGKAGEGGARVP